MHQLPRHPCHLLRLFTTRIHTDRQKCAHFGAHVSSHVLCTPRRTHSREMPEIKVEKQPGLVRLSFPRNKRIIPLHSYYDLDCQCHNAINITTNYECLLRKCARISYCHCHCPDQHDHLRHLSLLPLSARTTTTIYYHWPSTL